MLLASGLYGYAALSAVVTGAVIANAVTAREQFYSTVVHLTTSKGSLMAVANMVIVLGVLLGQLVKVLFLGTLRNSEVEHLNERIWPTITDTLLMMTMFRDEIGFLWGALFGLLIFFRVFAWLAADRVAYIEVNPNMSRGSYVRLFAMLVTFIVVDSGFLYFCVNETLLKGPSQLIMFGFEYTLVLISLVVSLVKYAFNVVDARSANGWDNKGVCVLYLDFTSDLLRLLTYVSFFGIVCHYYGLPLHIVRQTWLSLRSFRKSLDAVTKYRRATENMDLRFPDATATDLQRFDSTCIVCRDEIQEGGKKLPCQHILHKKCLTRWLERSHTCPICSASVFVEDNVGPNAHRNQLNEEAWGEMGAQNANNNNAQHFGGGAGAGGNNAGEEEREPVERHQGANVVHMPAVMAEMPQVVTPSGQIDAERLLEHMQLLQEQIGLLSDQVALLQAQLLSTLPANAPQPQPVPATPQRTSPSPVAPAPAQTEVAPAALPAVAAPQTTPSPSVQEGRANLSSSLPVTQDEREQRNETREDGGDGGGGGASPASQRALEDSPLDEIRRRRLQRFRSSAGPDA